jgi:DNA repair protein RecN (Recombination protein N)
MPKARFLARFHSDCRSEAEAASIPFTASGLDRIEFLFSANPGEDLKPLARVASGGELSRMLLAVKTLLSGKEDTETLIFDEVDAGIGGKTAELVGLQLEKLARRYQVICITHLPQIACYGRHHLRVVKDSNEQETSTRVIRLEPDSRIEELARMMGGIAISDKTRAHAREFLERAQGQRGRHQGLTP